VIQIRFQLNTDPAEYFDNFELTRKLNIKILGINKKAAYVIEKNKKMINVKEHF